VAAGFWQGFTLLSVLWPRVSKATSYLRGPQQRSWELRAHADTQFGSVFSPLDTGLFSCSNFANRSRT
jgi:hypothetical protein